MEFIRVKNDSLLPRETTSFYVLSTDVPPKKDYIKIEPHKSALLPTGIAVTEPYYGKFYIGDDFKNHLEVLSVEGLQYGIGDEIVVDVKNLTGVTVYIEDEDEILKLEK